MTFIWPVMLVSLLCLPLLVWFYIQLQRRRQRIAERYGSFTGRQNPGRRPGRQRHVPALLFLAGLALLLIAMARPQMTVSVPRLEGVVVLAFDISGSMAAEDLEPNRMAAAKVAAAEFVQRQPENVRIGIVAFSESGLAVQQPTNDRDEILASINRLEPQTGTSLGYGILTALKTIVADNIGDHTGDAVGDTAGANGGEDITGGATSPGVNGTDASSIPEGNFNQAIIVLISDGENTAPPDPFEAAYAAAERGVRIYSIGIGSPAGATINVDGYMIHTQLNEAALEQIAGLTGGEYFNAVSDEDLKEIYAKISPQLVIKPEEMEITAILAGASILILLIGGGLMLLWFGRLP